MAVQPGKVCPSPVGVTFRLREPRAAFGVDSPCPQRCTCLRRWG